MKKKLKKTKKSLEQRIVELEKAIEELKKVQPIQINFPEKSDGNPQITPYYPAQPFPHTPWPNTPGPGTPGYPIVWCINTAHPQNDNR